MKELKEQIKLPFWDNKYWIKQFNIPSFLVGGMSGFLFLCFIIRLAQFLHS